MYNTQYNSFTQEDITETKPALKIGLLASITPDGFPHVTLISSVMACGQNQLCFGQFTEGLSKNHITLNPKTGFLIMSLDKKLWRGTADFTHTAKQGAEFDYYNNVPMFRYNAYFGVHTVYYLDLISHTGKSALPMTKVIFSAIQTMISRLMIKKKSESKVVLNTWTQSFMNKMDHLKFISYIGSNGYPVIIPAIQTQALDTNHLVFSTSVYKDELLKIPKSSKVCVFGLSLDMEDVLLRGNFKGIRQGPLSKAGIIEVDWVYNSMPPVPGQIYPPLDLKPIDQF